MRNSITRNLRRLSILSLVVAALALPLMSSARTATSVNIVNNSSKDIRHVFLSHVTVDNWSSDQLPNTSIAPGQSYTLSNLSCDQQQIRVIAENQDGCFLTAVISCGTSETWTITNGTPVDCGQ